MALSFDEIMKQARVERGMSADGSSFDAVLQQAKADRAAPAPEPVAPSAPAEPTTNISKAYGNTQRKADRETNKIVSPMVQQAKSMSADERNARYNELNNEYKRLKHAPPNGGTQEQFADWYDRLTQLSTEMKVLKNPLSAKEDIELSAASTFGAIPALLENISDTIVGGGANLLADIITEGKSILTGNDESKAADWLKRQAENVYTTDGMLGAGSWSERTQQKYDERITDTRRAINSLAGSGVQMVGSLAIGNLAGAAASSGTAANTLTGAANAARAAQITQGASKAALGMGAAGSSTKQALGEGAEIGDAIAYGQISGLMETAIESVAGGIPGMGRGKLGEAVDAVMDLANRSGFLSTVIDLVGEGAEETVSAFLQPYAQRMYYNPEAKNATLGELGEAFASGAALSAIMQGAAAGANALTSRGGTVQTTTDVAQPQNAPTGELNGAQQLTPDAAETIMGTTDETSSAQNSRVNTARNMLENGASASRVFNETGIVVMANGDMRDGVNGPTIWRANNGEAAYNAGRSDYAGYSDAGREVETLRNPDAVLGGNRATSGQSAERAGFGQLADGDKNRLISFVENNFDWESPEADALLREFGDDIGTLAEAIYNDFASGRVIAENNWARLFTNPDAVFSAFETNGTNNLPEGMGAASAGFMGDTERGFSRNIATDENMAPELREDFRLDPQMYHQLGNKDTLAKAQAIFDRGLSTARGALERAIGAAQNGAKLAPEMVPLSRLVANELVAQGDITSARGILEDVAVELTAAGQLGQAAAILRNADPQTLERTIQKTVDEINKHVKSKKWRAELTEDEIRRIYSTDLQDTAAIEDLYADIAERVGREMPATAMEKLREIRRMFMLLNPKTQVKNIAGNVPLMGERFLSERLSGAIQGALVKMGWMDAADRTRTFHTSKESKAIARQAYEQNKGLLKGHKYNDAELNELIRENRKFFSGSMQTNNALQKGVNAVGQAADAVREFTYALLEMGDAPFVKSAFESNLAQLIEAQGIKSVDELTNEQIEYAKQKAFEATFKDASALANYLNALKNKRGIGTAVDILFPFTTTPINIGKQFAHYSPLGALYVWYDIANKKGAAHIIDDIAKTATGSAVVALGFLLAKLGLATGSADDDKDKRAFEQQTGVNAYSFGGKWSYNWAQPVGSALAMGADIYNAVKDNDSILQAIMEGVFAAGDAYLNTSFFQNIIDLMNGYGGSLTERGITELLTSGASQFTPSLFGGVARTIDDKMRSTYTGGTVLNDIWSSVKAKIPWASKTLPAAVNTRGEEKVRGGGVAGRAVNEFLNPGGWNYGEMTALDQIVQDVYDATGDKTVFPSVAEKKAKDGTPLTGEEYEQAQKTMGTAYYDLLAEFATNGFAGLTDAQKATVLSEAVSFSRDKANRELANSRGEDFESNWDKRADMPANALADVCIYGAALSSVDKDAGKVSPESYTAMDALLDTAEGVNAKAMKMLEEKPLFSRLLEAYDAGVKSEQFMNSYNSVKALGEGASFADKAGVILRDNALNDNQKWHMLYDAKGGASGNKDKVHTAKALGVPVALFVDAAARLDGVSKSDDVIAVLNGMRASNSEKSKLYALYTTTKKSGGANPFGNDYSDTISWKIIP